MRLIPVRIACRGPRAAANVLRLRDAGGRGFSSSGGEGIVKRARRIIFLMMAAFLGLLTARGHVDGQRAAGSCLSLYVPT